nr:uncharacterized protein LOC113689294 [Coffea arabica]
MSAQPSPIPTKLLSSHKGEVAVFFSVEDISKLASPFRLSLVGKFSRGRPKLEDIKKFVRSLDLKDSYMVGHMDARHVLIHCSSESDFHRLWLRGIWYVGKFPMRVFKWSSSFHVNRESSLAPIWFSLPGLPVHFFNKHSLFSVVQAVGEPLFLGAATVNLTRPSIARICVEVDLLHLVPSWVWIGVENSSEGFWQSLEAEYVPQYCTNCWHLGHANSQCQKADLGGPMARVKDTRSAAEVQVGVVGMATLTQHLGDPIPAATHGQVDGPVAHVKDTREGAEVQVGGVGAAPLRGPIAVATHG